MKSIWLVIRWLVLLLIAYILIQFGASFGREFWFKLFVLVIVVIMLGIFFTDSVFIEPIKKLFEKQSEDNE